MTDKNQKYIDEENENLYLEYHSCPFQEEINNNYDPEYCTCSEEDIHQCTMEI